MGETVAFSLIGHFTNESLNEQLVNTREDRLCGQVGRNLGLRLLLALATKP